jgi:ribosomal protein L7/L12
MFCPKCGTQNPETGRFCRSCGADLGNVSAALSGNLPQAPYVVDPRKRAVSWETAITKLFTGLAFLIIAGVLGITGMAGGKAWWFWMLIPAFGALGSGVAQLVQLKKLEKKEASFTLQNTQTTINSAPQNNALPPTQIDYIEINQLIHSGNKIEAIKVYRETFGSSLKDAKEAVDEMEREQATKSNFVPPPRGSIYETGELEVPPSVTDNTTRHLEINSEGETMTLPRSKESM